MFGTAWAADKAAQAAVEGQDHGIFGNPETWVAVAFLLFVVLLGKILWTKVGELLDKRSATIAKALADPRRMALLETIDFLKEKEGYDFFKAYALSSIGVDFRVTQVVDGTQGIHSMIAKKLFVKDANSYWYRPR